jgi:hypothetical protein
MLSFTREQRGKAFDALPKDIKSALTSDSLIETYQRIGAAQALTIDRIGLFADVVTLTILGLLPREGLAANIAKELNIPTTEANELAQKANEEVFLKIREHLMVQKAEEEREEEQADEIPLASSALIAQASAAQPAAPASAPRPGFVPVGMQDAPEIPEPVQPSASRDSILDEIENPIPVDHPISVAPALPALPRAMEIIEPPKEEKMEAAKQFVVSKLSETVASPAQQASIDPDKFTQKPKGYEADPYRETIG